MSRKRQNPWIDLRPPIGEEPVVREIDTDEDVTTSFANFITSDYAVTHIPPQIYTKLRQSLDYIRSQNLQIHFIEKPGDVGIEIINAMDGNKEARFLSTNPPNPGLSVYSLSISTEIESETHTGRGLARLMVAAFVFEMIQKGKMTANTMLYIDSDASDGFWPSIGMRPTRQRSGYFPSISSGYELSIDLGGLSKWGLGYKHDRPFVGGKTRKHRSKRRKRRTLKKRRRTHKRKN